MELETVLRAMTPGAGWLDFAVLLAVVIAAIVAILLGTGLFFEVMNARHPERKVQKNRVNRRKWRELAYAPGSIFTLSLCFAAGLFAQWQGWALTPLPLSWWSGPLMLLISVLLYDTWFYWVHRLLHLRPMMRFHALHHTSVSPTCWTNHHETIVEALLNQLFYFVIVFVLPIPWPMLVAQKIYDQISGMLGHAGYEHFASPLARAPWPLASTVFHDQHHGHFRYNFAHTFSVWDRMMGTLYPGYDATVEAFERGAPPAEAPAVRSGRDTSPRRAADSVPK
ncbi:MAG: sterol desaturase family protein [Alphaproteobacteria bacterium]|nr:sterol desaturase family protein [Alphaproteobacteria bacterium]